MPRSSLSDLLGARFAFEQEADLPAFKSRTDDEHLDNVEIAWMLDQHRMDFARHVGWWDYLSGGRLGMLVSTQIDYMHELWARRPVSIANAIETVGASSYTIVQAVNQSGRTACLARSVLVVVANGKVEKIRPDIREKMEAARIELALKVDS